MENNDLKQLFDWYPRKNPLRLLLAGFNRLHDWGCWG